MKTTQHTRNRFSRLPGRMFRLAFVIIFLLVICPGPVKTQTPYADSLRQQISLQGEDKSKVNSLLTISDIWRFSMPDSSLKYATEALSLSERLQYDTGIFWSMVAVNGIYLVKGDYVREVEYAFRLQPIGRRLHTAFSLGFSNGVLSDCYSGIGEYDTSLMYWRNVIKICEDSVLTHEFASIYAMSSRIFSEKGWYDSALFYARKSFQHFILDPRQATDTTYVRFMQSNLFTVFGDAFNGLRESDSALYYYRASFRPSAMSDMDINIVDACNGMASLFHEDHQPDSAVHYARRAIEEPLSDRYPVGMLKAAETLAAAYETLHRHDSALKYMHLVLALKDSLFNRSRLLAFQNIVLKEKEKVTDAENAALNLRRQYRTYLLIAILLAASIIILILINNRRIRHLQVVRNSIADDLHDDIGSALSSISIMSELAKAKSPESGPLLNSISESTASIQENMSDIVWAVNPGNDLFENVFQRMFRFASEILEAKNIRLEFSSDPALASQRFTMNQRKNLYLFFKEAVNNAAKYSGARTLSISINKRDGWIHSVIADDGIGFDSQTPAEGNGLRSLARRAEELNAVFTLESLVGRGTTVRLKFKPVHLG